MTADPAIPFWLRWAESEGALHERVGDLTLVVLPGGLRDSLGLPEEVSLTADPEAAREDGAVLLGSGHPLLDHATETVLRRGDSDARVLAPTGPVPTEGSLLAKAREAFPVDHGRIDMAEPPLPCLLPVVRVGALITYAVALDERFQEQAEAWVDVEAGAVLPPSTATRLASAAQQPSRTEPAPVEVREAVETAHRFLDRVGLARRHALSGQLERARSDELARTRSYYQAMLAGLARRRLAARPERRGALDAKAETTRAERDRRLAEVEEKFRPHHDIRPFRLHLLWVPALRLAVHVKRGPRVYPMSLHWLRPAAAFTPVPCHGCGGAETWVAGKDRLGCRSCLPNAAVIPARAGAGPDWPVLAGSGQPPQPATLPTPAALPPPTAAARSARSVASVPSMPKPAVVAAQRRRTSPPAPPNPRAGTHLDGKRCAASRTDDRVVGPVGAASRKRLGAAGDKLGIGIWQAAHDGNRRLRRLIAPDSPAAALRHLYGAAAMTWVVGISPGDTPVAASASTLVRDSWSGVTTGVVETRREAWPYSIRWDLVDGRPAVTELLPVSAGHELRLPWQGYPRFMPPRLREPPPHLALLDPVAQALWRVLLPRGGLLLVARCLAAYWRIGEDAPVSAAPVRAIAGGLAHQVGRRAGLNVTYQQAAAEFDIDEDQLRATAAKLTRQLGLSATRVW